MNKNIKVKYRIKNKVRFTIFAVAMLLIMHSLVTGITGLNWANANSIDQHKTIHVNYGDTLWTIAAEYAPEDMDVREYIHIIKDINNLNSDSLDIGSKLEIPVL